MGRRRSVRMAALSALGGHAVATELVRDADSNNRRYFERRIEPAMLFLRHERLL
jgi:hypothetical protein